MDFLNPEFWYQTAMSDPQTFGPLLDGMGLTSDVVQNAMKNGGFDATTAQMLQGMSAGFGGQAGTESLAGGPGPDTLGPGAVRPSGAAGMGPMVKNSLGSLADPAIYGPSESTEAATALPPGRPVGGDISREPYPAPPAAPIYGPQEPSTLAGELQGPGGVGSDYARFPQAGAGGAQYGPAMSPGALAAPAAAAAQDPRIAAQRQLAANQGILSPKPPQPPPMHGGVTGGVKTPETKPIKPGSAAIQALLAALQQKPVPTLGHLVG